MVSRLTTRKLISLRLLTGLFALLFTTLALAADFTATVDRKQVAEGDTFTLSLRYGEQVGFGSPDLKPLQKDFQILNQQRSNQFRSINGKTESYTEWTLTLSARSSGTFTIPAIEFDGEKTKPITIEVKALSADLKAQQDKQFFFDIDVSQQENYYVQGQILYTEKLYYSVNHEDATLSEFKVTDARVQPLGDVRQYTTVIDGVRFGVYERRYAIFPETSGELVIPGQRFSATVSNPYDRWSRGRQASAVSKPIKLQVLPIPAAYPKAAWLPARSLTLSESFSTDPDKWRAGEPVTRTITITGAGLPGSQLPAIPMPVIDKVRYYPDQSQQNDNLGDDGITGTATQSIAIVPTASGRLVLPEVRIPWWNSRTGKLEYALLPSHTINVAAAKPQNIQGSTAAAEPENATDSSPAGSVSESTPAPALFASVAGWVALGVSVVLNLILLVLLLVRKPALKSPVHAATRDSNGKAWNEFSDACKRGDAAAARETLLQWVNISGLLADRVSSISQLAEQVQDPALKNALAELDATLFSAKGNSAWNGQNLLLLLKKLTPQAKAAASAGLYPQ